jgi:hypothetical protein
MNNDDVLLVLGVICLIVLLIIFLPLVLIFALNSLVPTLNIPYNLSTWFGSFLLGLLMRGTYTKK